MEKMYYVKFHYDGIEPKGLKKTIIEKEFVKAYKKYCDYTNPRIPKWNKKYDKMKRPHDFIDEDGTINLDSEYNKYMAGKFTIYTNKLTNYIRSDFIKKFMIGPECDFQAKLTDGTIMSFYIVEN